jgi:hypothetical protein
MIQPEVGPAGRRTRVAVLVAAAVGAIALPVRAAGIGWLVALAAVGGAILAARSERPGPDGGGAGRPGTGADRAGIAPDRAGIGADRAGIGADRGGADWGWRGAAGLAAVTMVAVPAVRAAPWLDATCLLAGVLLGSYALVGGSSWRQIARSAVALVPGIGHGLASFATRRTREPGRGAGRTLAAVAAGLALLGVFGSLFRAADRAFADLTDGWLVDASPTNWARAGVGLLVVGAIALGSAELISQRARWGTGDDGAGNGTGPRRLGLVEWVIPLAMLDALFGLFVWVQITVLFGADEFVLAPGGPDYAVYARGGSAELGVVTALTLGVFGILSALAGRSSRSEVWLLRVLGGVLGGLTLVIVVSALTRLGLYAGAYGLTVPRLLAYAGEVWLGLIVVLVLVAGIRLRTTWLPRGVAAAAVAVLLALVAVNPDALMARTVLHRLGGPYGVDVSFLATLSADAADELAAVPPQIQPCLLSDLAAQLSVPDPWYAANLSRAHARSVLATHPGAACTTRDG